MSTITERDISISIPEAAKARKFDEHELSYCMKAVDFIVELEDRVLFIEIKDPPRHSHARKEAEKFIQQFRSGNLDQELYYKYRDTFIYEWASGNIKKKIFYLLLIDIEELSEAELLNRSDELRRKLPVAGPSTGDWKKRIVSDCMVFNLESWNEYLTHYQANRLSSDA